MSVNYVSMITKTKAGSSVEMVQKELFPLTFIANVEGEEGTMQIRTYELHRTAKGALRMELIRKEFVKDLIGLDNSE